MNSNTTGPNVEVTDRVVIEIDDVRVPLFGHYGIDAVELVPLGGDVDHNIRVQDAQSRRFVVKLAPDEKAGLQLKVWLHPALNIVVLAGIVVVIAVMALSPQNAPQVWLSLATLALLLTVYPIVRRRNRRREHASVTLPGQTDPLSSSIR